MRIDYRNVAPEAIEAMAGLEHVVHESTLEPELREALLLLPRTGAPADVYLELERRFDQEEMVALTLAIVAINGRNRFAVGPRSPVGHYVSPHTRVMEGAGR